MIMRSQGERDEVQESRFAHFVDDDDDDSDCADESDTGSASVGGVSDSEQEFVRRKLADVPFSVLLRAQQQLQEANKPDDTTKWEEDEEDGLDGDNRAFQRKEAAKNLQELEKRDDRHAPTELSSRRPVTRRRQVVESRQSVTRDPRFSSLSASAPNKGLFTTSYNFLRQQQGEELKQLRRTLKKLKQQEAHHAGPRASSDSALRIREERQSVEATLRREEGRENERRSREHQAEVMRKAKKSIDDKVKQGAKRYYLKDSDKKRLILEDKFNRLSDTAMQGGEEARSGLRRAVDRRRKKNAARERNIPLGGGGGRGGASMHRSAEQTGKEQQVSSRSNTHKRARSS